MAFYSLPADWEITQKTKVERLKKIPAGYKNKFYRSLGDSFDKSFDTVFQRSIIQDVPSKDVKNYLLATSNFGKGMQDDINMYVTRDSLNNASFRQKLNQPIRLSSYLRIFLHLTHKTL